MKTETPGLEAKIIDTIDVPVKFEEVDTTGAIQCGLRQHWISGSCDGGESIELSAGAGFGSPWLQLQWNDGKGNQRQFRADMTKLISTFDEDILP